MTRVIQTPVYIKLCRGLLQPHGTIYVPRPDAIWSFNHCNGKILVINLSKKLQGRLIFFRFIRQPIKHVVWREPLARIRVSNMGRKPGNNSNVCDSVTTVNFVHLYHISSQKHAIERILSEWPIQILAAGDICIYFDLEYLHTVPTLSSGPGPWTPLPPTTHLAADSRPQSDKHS